MNLILNDIDMGKIEEFSETITNEQYDMEGGFRITFHKRNIAKSEMRYDDLFVFLKEEEE